MKLTEPIVFIRLSFGLPGRTRQLDNAASAAAESVGAKRERVKTTAQLYSGEAFGRIVSLDNASKAELLKLAIQIPTDFRGAYVLPRALLARAEDGLRQAQDERRQLVNSFVYDGAYSAERDRAQSELGSAFDPSDYPPAGILAERFTMSWRYFALDVPEELPAELRERETAKLQAEISQVAADCRQALRAGLAEMVNHLVERLTPAPDGRTKRLAATTVEGLREFLDTLAARDITGDTDIRQLGEQAKRILAGVSAESLRESDYTKEKIRAGLSQVGRAVAELAKFDGARKFDFSDEDTTAGAGAPAAVA